MAGSQVLLSYTTREEAKRIIKKERSVERKTCTLTTENLDTEPKSITLELRDYI